MIITLETSKTFDELKELFLTNDIDFGNIKKIELNEVEFRPMPYADFETIYHRLDKSSPFKCIFSSTDLTEHLVFSWTMKNKTFVPTEMTLLNENLSILKECKGNCGGEGKCGACGCGGKCGGDCQCNKTEENEEKTDLIPQDEESTDVETTEDNKTETVTDKKIIGDMVEVNFIGAFYGKKTEAKVDTGADVASLHAENIQITEAAKMVTFESEILSDNVITMAYETKQAVTSSDGGTEYRPVVKLDIEINGKKLNNMLFNLNDRSKMAQKVLIGQNILEKGKFLVDPNID